MILWEKWLFFQTESYHSNYAEAISEVSICRIHKKDMDDYLGAYPEIMRRILSDVTKRLQVSEKQTMQVGYGASRVSYY